jgi:hypothetical protein
MLVPDVTLVMSLCDVHTRHVIAQCDIHHCSMYVTWPPSTLTKTFARFLHSSSV